MKNGHKRVTYAQTEQLARQRGFELLKLGKGYELRRNGVRLDRPANLRDAWESIGHGGQTDEQYHADLSRWSRSMLGTFRDDRQEMAAILQGLMPTKKPTDRMNVGSATHDVLLRPGMFEAGYVIMPEDIKTRQGRRWEGFQLANYGKVILPRQDYADVMGMCLSVRSTMADLLDLNPVIETPIYFDYLGLPCKCRPDMLFLGDDRILVVDIKTSLSIRRGWFESQCTKLRYWLQDAHYSRGIYEQYGAIPEFWFLLVKSKPPYTSRIFQIKPRDRERARETHGETIAAVVNCLGTGDWRNPWERSSTSIEIRDFR